MNAKEKRGIAKAVQAAEEVERAQKEWYSLRRILGNSNWAIFYILLGGRETGKSYSITEFFVKKWKQKKIPFIWIRLNEASMKKMLVNNAEKLVDPDLYRKYNLNLTVKGNTVYDNGEKMATVLALSTFANDKGVAMFDKDFLEDVKMCYHICLDEFQLEKTQRSQGDIAYQFVQQMENLVRSTKERLKIFLVGNTLEEASDVLKLFNFIPENFGIYKVKKKRAVIDYMCPSEAYKRRRRGSVADILMGDVSNFTNKIDFDRTLVFKGKLLKPQSVIHFGKEGNKKFTLWSAVGGKNVICEYKNEKLKNNISMRPYLDLVYNNEIKDGVIQMFDQRAYLYRNLITHKKFQSEIEQIKPRKNG